MLPAAGSMAPGYRRRFAAQYDAMTYPFHPPNAWITMLTRRKSLKAGASIFVSTLFAPEMIAQAPGGFAAIRKGVGKRACYKCDDRGQIQANLGGGIVEKPSVAGVPDVAWVQQGYVLCPDCKGESKEFRTACSQVKDGVLPIVKLARKRIEAHKAAGTLKNLEAKAKQERSKATTYKLFASSGFLANAIAHYQAATLTRGVIRSLVVRWKPSSVSSAARSVQSGGGLVDKPNLITSLDIVKFAAASLDIKYREPCGFPPEFNGLPTFKTGTIPDKFILQLLG
jgi:hypothetical protein